MREISLAVLERIMKKAGAKRVSKKALMELREEIMNYAIKISTDAVMLAKHANRITVLDTDIRMALRK